MIKDTAPQSPAIDPMAEAVALMDSNPDGFSLRNTIITAAEDDNRFDTTSYDVQDPVSLANTLVAAEVTSSSARSRGETRQRSPRERAVAFGGALLVTATITGGVLFASGQENNHIKDENRAAARAALTVARNHNDSDANAYLGSSPTSVNP